MLRARRVFNTLAIFAVGGSCLMLSACFVFGDISSQDARDLVQNGARLIDVRSAKEYAGGHIDGAQHIPLNELAVQIASLGSRTIPTVVYCRSGYRSNKAAKLLRKAGFKQVYNLGPQSRW